MVDLGSVTFFLVYHESFLLSSAKLLKLIDMGANKHLPTLPGWAWWWATINRLPTLSGSLIETILIPGIYGGVRFLYNMIKFPDTKIIF